MRIATIGVMALLLAPAAQALPLRGLVVEGRSVGGVRLGMRPAEVTAKWGRRHGICRSCRFRTWYFNYVRFKPQGLGAVFSGGRVVALFTHWSPTGWHTNTGVRTGDPERRVTEFYPRLTRHSCGHYDVLVHARGRERTQFFVYDGKVWGLGISRESVPPCR
jgi:hypothetical protein